MDKILEKKGNNVLLKIALNWKNLCEIYNAYILTVDENEFNYESNCFDD